jgi:hypothetical protein
MIIIMKLRTWWVVADAVRWCTTRIVTIAGRKELVLKTDNNNMSMLVT